MSKKNTERSALDIALAGNPNVGKSTVFNALTGMKQHTGNWTGKTVETARGSFVLGDREITLTDLPGTYSLMAHSAEEQVARDYICFSGSDGVIIVCDASCLERNLNLVLQVMEITPKVIVCINLIDEAEKKKIFVDADMLSGLLGVKVCRTAARNNKGLDELVSLIGSMESGTVIEPPVIYNAAAEKAIAELILPLDKILNGRLPSRFAALRILEGCEDMICSIDSHLETDIKEQLCDEETELCKAYISALNILKEQGISSEQLCDMTVESIVARAEEIAAKCVVCEQQGNYGRDRKIDRILTHRILGIPLMLLILTVIFYITIIGANYPSQWLSAAFSSLGDVLEGFLEGRAPQWLTSLLMDGVYCVITWVASVMLPPMAIFFPLFTFLEDIGYLPRAAFNLDRFFSRAKTCGKQALTMAMGLGCNAAGIIGCRIIDSPRERLIAQLTNNFMPCNGRFSTLIALSAVFFSIGASGGALASAAAVTLLIVLGALLTLLCSRLLSVTVLKGKPSSFALELPPYRSPQIGKILVRSLLDRTVFVLGRAITAAAPAGLIIWLMANLHLGDTSLLGCCSDFLDPIGSVFGMDGAILLAFILGFPANEIVIPILLMIYTDSGVLTEYSSLTELGAILRNNGWTWVTALCTMIFMLCHYPCSTACMTLKKETGSWKWTIMGMVLPTAAGLIICALISGLSLVFGA